MNIFKKLIPAIAAALVLFAGNAKAGYTIEMNSLFAKEVVQVSGSAVTQSHVLTDSNTIPVTKFDVDNNTIQLAIPIKRANVINAQGASLRTWTMFFDVTTAALDADPTFSIVEVDTNTTTGAATVTTLTTTTSGSTCTLAVGIRKICTVTVGAAYRQLDPTSNYYVLMSVNGAANSDLYLRVAEESGS